MNAIIYSFLLLVATTFVDLDAQQYKFVESMNGIDMFTKVEPEGNERWTKLVTEIDAPIETVTAFTGSVSNLSSWVYACDRVELIQEDANETIYYLVSDMPYPMTDRDVIIRKEITRNEDLSKITSVSENFTLIEKKSSLVRIPRFKTIWQFEQLPSGKTKVTYEVSADPGGSIPNWVKDRFEYYGPLKSLENLKERFEA